VSRVGHVIHFSVHSNGNLDRGGNGCAIESNWEVNYSNQKFRGDIEKWVKVQDGKV
jgi:hypothetical protein